MQQITQATPQRLLNVDALRGFALFGILAVNIWMFADPHYSQPLGPNPAYQSTLDRAVRGLVALLFETKFYLLFSFLFGYSVTLQMTAAERAGAALLPRMLRRQAGLLALGLAHGLVLYNGDILTAYSLLGLILLASRHTPSRALVKRAIAITAISGALWLLLAKLETLFGSAPADGKLDILAAYSGSAAQTLHYNIANFPMFASLALMAQGGSALSMFFLGLVAGRARLLEHPERFGALQRRLLRYGLPVGLAGAALYAATSHSAASAPLMLGLGVTLLTAPLLTAAYAIGMLRLFAGRLGQRLQHALAPMGRMALSNYLGQSLAMSLIFTGYGLGLMNRLPPAAVLACVVAIYLAQMLASRWWMRHHAYGPAEWLLRALTTASLPRWRAAHRPLQHPMCR